MMKKYINQITYRESGTGKGQTFTWTKVTRELRLEDEEGNMSQDVHLLSEHEQIELEQLLLHVDLMHWQPEYTTEWLILDGTYWEISWTGSEGNGASQGSNAYPDGWELLRDWLYRQFEKEEFR
ncbi:hypothetical protein [Exiguobacterium undae]|uniref:hypothetical protein n=1 Tax=Exiguobacterium undae TaxID=169177 RepID=UPI00384ECB62